MRLGSLWIAIFKTAIQRELRELSSLYLEMRRVKEKQDTKKKKKTCNDTSKDKLTIGGIAAALCLSCFKSIGFCSGEDMTPSCA